jgi:hypothetical protein
MDLTSLTAPAVDVLPAERTARRWRLGRERAVPLAELADVIEESGPDAEAFPVDDPAAEPDVTRAESDAGSDVESAAPAETGAHGEDPAPLASFGRWLADIEGAATSPVAADEAPAEPSVAEPPADPAADADLVRSLKREVQQLAEELETVRQRTAAERMSLLQQLSDAREARHAAELELASVQAVLDAAEARLPRPRHESFLPTH